MICVSFAWRLDNYALRAAFKTSPVESLCERPVKNKGNICVFMIMPRKRLVWLMHSLGESEPVNFKIYKFFS
jgi:hypothetical protein